MGVHQSGHASSIGCNSNLVEHSVSEEDLLMDLLQKSGFS